MFCDICPSLFLSENGSFLINLPLHTASTGFSDLYSCRHYNRMTFLSFTEFYRTDHCHISHIKCILQYSCQRRIHRLSQFPIIKACNCNIPSNNFSSSGAFPVCSLCHHVIRTDHRFHIRICIQQLIHLTLYTGRIISIGNPVSTKLKVIFLHHIIYCLPSFSGICITVRPCQIGEVPVSVIFYQVFCDCIHSIVIICNNRSCGSCFVPLL